MKGNILHRKERLVITTIDTINELGIQNLSTREIAKREGVSEATLFRHYNNKNELLLAVLDYYAKFDKDLFLTTRMKNLEPIRAIVFIISSLVEYYENYSALTALTQMFDVLRKESDLSEKVETILNGRANNINILIEEAQKKGQIRNDINSKDLTNMINGFVRETTLRWRVEGFNFSLKERVLGFLDVLLGAMK